SEYERIRELIAPELQQLFRPEFLNRVDDIIYFHPLTRQQVRRILDLMLAQTQARLKEQMIDLRITDRAQDLLAELGYSREYGARSLRRTVQSLVEDRLAEALLQGRFDANTCVTLDVGEGQQLSLATSTAAIMLPDGGEDAQSL